MVGVKIIANQGKVWGSDIINSEACALLGLMPIWQLSLFICKPRQDIGQYYETGSGNAPLANAIMANVTVIAGQGKVKGNVIPKSDSACALLANANMAGVITLVGGGGGCMGTPARGLRNCKLQSGTVSGAMW